MLELDEKTFEKEVTESKKLIVDFFADWCGPCKALAPALEKLSQEYKDVKFAKVNVEVSPELSEKNEVRGIPCIILFKNGKEADRLVGYRTEEILKKDIDAMIKA